MVATNELALEELVWLALRRAAGVGPYEQFGSWGLDVTHAQSPYTPPASRQAVPVDTTDGVVVINSPLAADGVSFPADGQVVIVKPTAASVNPISFVANGAGVTVEDPSSYGSYTASVTIAGQGPAVRFKYRSSDKRWITW